MSERYSKIYSLPENLYAQESPLVIKAGSLLRDNESNCLIGQIKLHSISKKTIKMVKIELTCLDSVGRVLDSPITFDYLDLFITRGMDFGSQTPIKIANSATRSYKVKVIEVGFSDNTIWYNSENEWTDLPKQSTFSSKDNNPKAMHGYKSFFGNDARLTVLEHNDIWLCACGQVNHNNEESCYNCGSSLSKLKNIDEANLISEGTYVIASAKSHSNNVSDVECAKELFSSISEYKDSANLVDICSKKIEELNNKQKVEDAKRKKIIKRSSLFATALVALGLVGYFIFYPLVSYWFGNYKVYIDMYNIEEFEIPDGVSKIKKQAFVNCDSLTRVVIPDSITEIGENAFYNCDSLTSVVIGDSVTTIGEDAFEYCESLTSIVIPDSVTTIGDSAFACCDSLTSVEIPDSVTTIGEYAFYDCDSLTSVEIPDSVTEIGSGAFSSCDSLTSVVIPDSVTEIGSSAFSSCDSLTSVVIPDSVTTIGDYAFSGCDRFTSVVIPDSVTTIGEGAFAYCHNLTSVKYTGTIAQWKSIDRDYDWNYGTGNYIVYCTDGTL